MRHIAVREHLKHLLRVRSQWDFYTKYNTGFFANKVSFFTINGRLILTKPELEVHIERTRKNLKRKSWKNLGTHL